MNYYFEDFTEDNYRQLLILAKKYYRFEKFGTTSKDKHVLWRHDIDFSVHRALRIAEIEAEESVTSTYFILLHSGFYNVFEKEVCDRLKLIKDFGHDLALHFDLSFYKDIKELQDLETKLTFEKNILEEMFETSITVFSYHNPDTVKLNIKLDTNKIAGLINVYGDDIQSKYTYCSDSNGYWRYARLQDVLNENKAHQLHVLTHACWWVDDVMSPRERVSRCINGRASANHKMYDAMLSQYHRENIGQE